MTANTFLFNISGYWLNNHAAFLSNIHNNPGYIFRFSSSACTMFTKKNNQALFPWGMENQTNYCRFPKSLHLMVNIDRTSLCAMIHKSYTPRLQSNHVVGGRFFESFCYLFFSLAHDIGVCKCITNPNNSSYRNVTFLELKPILRLLFLLESEQFLLYLCYNQAVCYNKRNRMQKPKPSVMFRSCPLKYDPPERKYSSFNWSGP